MRLVLTLRSTHPSPYDLCYHRNLQGFIYSLIRRAGYLDLHDKPGCKFFSFSNLIPPGRRIEAESRKTLVASSPDSEMIASLQDEAKRIEGEEIKIGGMGFRLEKSKTVETSIPDGFGEFTLDSGTPIVIRIPRHRLKGYDITPTRDYDYVYWRKEYTPTPFIKQLEENLLKKYNEYSGIGAEEAPIFEKLKFVKQVAVPLRMADKQTIIIGTMWEFYLQPVDGLKRDMLQFGLDAGFGEMNSLAIASTAANSRSCFNRSMVELKVLDELVPVVDRARFNRSMVELKEDSSCFLSAQSGCFNRSMVELKDPYAA